MSLAKLHITEKSRKEWTCGSCGDVIPKGSRVIRFTVGYRGFPQERCSKPECYPKPSDRESSLVSEVYAAQEAADFSACSSKEDLDSIIEDVQAACENVVSEYEANEMFERNYDLQERADTIRNAGEELDSWADNIDDEPQEDDKETWGEHLSFAEAHSNWLEDAREAAMDAVNNMELP